MNKKIIRLVICIVLFAGLIGTYFLLQNKKISDLEKETEVVATDAPSTVVALIEKKAEDVKSFTTTTENGMYTFIPQEVKDADGNAVKKWVLGGNEQFPLNQSTLNSMATSLYSLYASDTLGENLELSEYGINKDKNIVTINFKDGTSDKINFGSKTSDGSYYYFNHNDGTTVYLLSKTPSGRFLSSLDGLIDKTLPQIDVTQLQYVDFKQKDQKEIEIGFDGTDEEKQNQFTEYGMTLLTMLKPYKGRDVYADNLNRNVLTNINDISLGTLIDPIADDLSQYGLDNPVLTFTIKDTANEISLMLGNDTEDGMIYVKETDKPYVYKTDKSQFATYFNVEANRFIEKFIALVNISDINGLEIIGEDNSYNFEINHDIQEPVEGQTKGTDVITPVLNGTEYPEDPFKTFYQLLIGLVYDQEIEEYAPTGDPAITMKYNYIDGSPDEVVKLYNYDDNFYGVSKNNGPIQFVTNKQSVNYMLTGIKKLQDGTLE